MEDPLNTIRNQFFIGAWDKVVQQEVPDGEEGAAARSYIYRARIERGELEAVLHELEGEELELPGERALLAYARYLHGEQEALEEMEALVQESGDDGDVQVLAATALHRERRTEDALEVLSNTGTLDGVVLAVQLHLARSRTDLAEQECKRAKGLGEAVPVELAEAWVHLRKGGTEYDAAFYILEEMAQTPASQTSKTLLCQAIAELHLGRLPEAEVALQQVLDAEPAHADALANAVVAAILSSKPREQVQELYSRLEAASSVHELVQSTREKSRLFDEAASKYAVEIDT